MLAQRAFRLIAGTAGMAALASLGACNGAGLGGLGGIGNVLGGVLAPQGTQIDATIQSVDTRNQVISLQQSNGQGVGVRYDNNTRVVYQNQLYPVTSLEYGDQVIARIIDNGNNSYYTDSVYVTRPVNGSTTGDRGVYNGTGGTNGAVQTLAGTVRQYNRSSGYFTIDAGGGTQLTVTLPYNANSQDVNRFNNLRIGDYVRFYGVYLNNSRVELRQFY